MLTRGRVLTRNGLLQKCLSDAIRIDTEDSVRRQTVPIAMKVPESLGSGLDTQKAFRDIRIISKRSLERERER